MTWYDPFQLSLCFPAPGLGYLAALSIGLSHPLERLYLEPFCYSTELSAFDMLPA